jgi:glycosyltransferase involved in cell wall biosynthesis
MAPSYLFDKEVDVPVHSLDIPGLLGNISFWELAIRMIRRRADRYDLVLIHHPVLLSDNFLSLRNRIVLTFHGTYYGYSRAYHLYKLGHYGSYYDTASRIERKLLNNLSDNPSHKLVVTGVSPSTISELRANGYTGIAHFVPNAMPHLSEIVNKQRARTLWNSFSSNRINQNDKILLYVGSSKNIASKRPLLVPLLFQKITKHSPNIKLVMVGMGSSSHEIEKLATEFSNISCLGVVPHDRLHLLYSAADIYISLSCYEGLPNSALEAAAHRLPLVLSDIPAHRWIISKGIGYGILVNPFDPQTDISKVSTLLDSLDSQNYTDSNTQIDFSWDQIAKSYLAIAKVN